MFACGEISCFNQVSPVSYKHRPIILMFGQALANICEAIHVIQ